MAKKTQIGAIITLDGEAKFRQSLQNCKTNVSAFRNDLDKIKQTYEGNLNSLEALSKMQEKYAQIEEETGKQVELTSKRYIEASKQTEEIKEKKEEMLKAYEREQDILKDLLKDREADADTVKRQEKAVENAKEEYEKYEKALEKCETRDDKLRRQMIQAEKQQIKAGNAVKKYGDLIEEASNNADKCATSIDNMGKAIRSSGDSSNSALDSDSLSNAVFAGATKSNLIIAAVTKISDLASDALKQSYEVGSTFEASMSNVKALSGETVENLTLLEAKAEELGASTRYSASQVADGFSYMSLAGWEATEMLDGINGVLNLASAGSLDLAKASDLLTDYLSAFGLTAKDSSYFADMLAYAQANSNTTVEALGEAYKNCAANMNAGNQSIQTTTALLEVLANNGIKGSEAGTKLSAIMRDLTSKMKDGKVSIGDTSVAVKDADGNFRDLLDILTDVEDAVDGMGTADKASALKNIFTAESISGVNIVLKDGTDLLKQYKEELYNVNGVAEEMAGTMDDNMQGSVASLNSALEGLGITAFKIFDGPLRAGIDALTTAIGAVNDGFKSFFDNIFGEEDVNASIIDSYLSKLKESREDIQKMQNEAMDSLFAFDGKNLDTYIKIIKEARKETELSDFEMYALNNAIQVLASNGFTELNKYINNTNGLLELSSSKFDELTNSMDDNYKQLRTQAILTSNAEVLQASMKSEAELNKAKAAKKVIDKMVSDAEVEIDKLTERKITEEEISANDLYASEEYKAKLEDLNVLTERQTEAKKELAKQQELYNEGLKESQLNTEIMKQSLIDMGHTESEAVDILKNAGYEIKDTTDTMRDGISSVGDAYSDTVNEINSDGIKEALQGQFGGAIDEITAFKDSLSNTLSGVSLFGDSSSVRENFVNADTKEQMERFMSQNLGVMRKYTSELNELKERGLSSDFISYINGLGIQEASEVVHNMFVGTDDDLKAYQEYWDQYKSVINGTDEYVNEMLNSMADSIMDGVEGGKNSWYQYGIETTQGLIDALNERARQIANGELTGTVTDAMISVMSENATQSEAIETANTRDAQISRSYSRSGLLNRVYEKTRESMPDITVNVSLDGDKISSNIEKRINENGKRTGTKG